MKEKLLALIQYEIEFFERMIVETMSGGWSTNHVDKMNKRIAELKSMHYNISINNV